ncbi:MAG: hypothetical protein A3C93_00720 [Candidatus Lloydbacteria bacterium RIFCSPHIGHO2_02_FULL_54_17]|uniref:Glycine zipper 2TM domain-containing protein n=1 Tax=Candidatus Lloydbacteria bacterium RIFCSPHIGHO2_02_FULL_54_17 TaxID=1798664 RepID=A0A1G2DF44_9BACT|nr:MAG: hypothetical protein A2762_03640 [Candidatus Lloydbacteria bacterium RIFCSPHIGHO2_01_FULL_54_11]OGZ12163.1 MAG: hypothetical protein A3C93_00720 [Candidatus Lloydbacteria bacterium RIFCSPHIGHO2_02_FULL_54_17]OGZ12954.1 MAG: hypothetical protein A2948_01165 [Candidatus Lloydbacteria bacterium RIFCSPLOWO2_01_FULL_54_18]OGZ15965.1 MAG: hypothetical protein A3H76_02530 [Candidatus Lloydbacteria bacterium RIFCSPLOWO2_02_FULL_54_12]
MKMRGFAVAVGVVAMLGGCSNIPKGDQGMVIGGVLGGLAGSTIGGGSGRVIATIAGALIGGYVGHEVGQHMDREDRARHERAVAETVANGGRHTWHNPRTRRHGGATAGRYYETPRGYCREYREYVVIDGREVPAHGTACRQPDGSWRIMN